jgi:uncharacterized protein YbjT (DUF2867 family)
MALRILLTGVTGYVGGRLLTLLAQQGHAVRAMVRDHRRAPPMPEGAEAVEADALQGDSLLKAMEGIDVAYYLIHGMGGDPVDFTKREVLAASNFAEAARKQGVKRIIYLGGLGKKEDKLSLHLRTRQLTGEVLRASGVPTTEFRAGIIIGAGAYSFEILRYLTERLPILLCPRWVRTKAQPIATKDVLRYLIDCLDIPETVGQIIEIGGRDILSYEEMIRRYAKIRDLKRWLIPLPFLSPKLSALWIDLVTPIPSQIAHYLVEGLRNEVIVTNDLARKLFPFEPMSYDEAVEVALKRIEAGTVETTWSGSSTVFSLPAEAQALDETLSKREGMIIERYQKIVNCPQEHLWKTVVAIGGVNGWPYANLLWVIRGIIDRLIGGIGMRRGRRNQSSLQVGDTVDFWRVESCEPPRLLRLRAEMKLPGRGWLQFELHPIDADHTALIQTCFYEPHGLFGQLYWDIFLPAHQLIFPGMVRNLQKEAEQTWHPQQHSSLEEAGASAPPSAPSCSKKGPES